MQVHFRSFSCSGTIFSATCIYRKNKTKILGIKIIHVVEPFASGVVDLIATIINQDENNQHTVVHGSRLWVDDEKAVRSKFRNGTRFIRWKYVNRPIHPFFDFLSLLFLIKIFRRNHFDVIHLHSSKAGFLGRLAFVFSSIKNVIYTPHGAPFIRKDISQLQRRLFIFLERIGSYLPGKIICCSRSEMQVYLRHKINADYINNGIKINPNQHKRQKDKYRIRIGFAGILTEQKNPKEFNAVASSFVSDSRVEFLWIGDGGLREYISSNNVIVTGWVSKSKVRKYLETIDIYLSCSLWEGLPLAVLEAMSLGNPLVLRNSIGNKDLVESGLNGYLYNTKDEAVDSLSTLIEDKDLRIKMGNESARLCSKSFNQKDTFEKYMIEYGSTF